VIIKHLHSKNANITVIPNNTEKFIRFQMARMKYLDSFKFLPSSLDNLVQNLHNDGVKLFKYTQLTFGISDPSTFQKGIYPYECMVDRNVFKETSLPPKEAFYSRLKVGRKVLKMHKALAFNQHVYLAQYIYSTWKSVSRHVRKGSIQVAQQCSVR